MKCKLAGSYRTYIKGVKPTPCRNMKARARNKKIDNSTLTIVKFVDLQ